MPKIRDYGTPNLDYQGVHQESFANLSNSGDIGRAVSNVGQAVDTVGDQVYHRQAQEETSNINANFSELASDAAQEIDQKTRDGTINAEEFKEGLQDKIDDMDQNISTRAGRNAFERNAARVKGLAVKRAARGQAAVAGEKAVDNFHTELNNHAMAITVDPSAYADHKQMMMDSLDDQVSTGVIKSPAVAERLKLQARNNLAEASVRSWAKLNPDIAEKKLYSGEYKDDLDSNSISQMQDYINKVRVAKGAEESRTEASQKRAEKAAGDAFMAQNLHGIVNGTLDSNKILDAPGLKPQFKLDLLKKVQQHSADGGGVTNPAAENDIHQRILADPSDPRKIVDESQFIDQVGKGLSWKTYEKLAHDIPKTPDGEAYVKDKKAALEVAKSEILQQGFTALGGSKYSADSQRMLQVYIEDSRKAEQQAVKDKKPLSSLYDSNSKDYLASPERLKKYKVPYKQYFDNQAQERLKQQPAFSGSAPPPAAKFKSIEEYESSKPKGPGD